MKCLRITNWVERYEVTDQGRPVTDGRPPRRKPLPWVRWKVNGRTLGSGFREMLRVAGDPENAEAAYATFGKLLELAADNPPELRGWILDHQRQPATPAKIAYFSGFRESTIWRGLAVLTHADIEWVTVSVFGTKQTTAENLQIFDRIKAGSGEYSPLVENLQEPTSPPRARARADVSSNSQSVSSSSSSSSLPFPKKPAKPGFLKPKPEKPKPTKAERIQAEAESLWRLWRKNVKQHDDTGSRARRHIVKHLNNGDTFSDLEICILNYSEAMRIMDREEQYRKSCGNFFGRDAVYESYRKGKYAKPTPSRRTGIPSQTQTDQPGGDGQQGQGRFSGGVEIHSGIGND